MKKLIAFLFFTPLYVSAATYSGYTEPYKNLELSFPEAGIITKINVKEGDRVTKGQNLAELFNRVLQAELAIAKEKYDMRKTRFDKLNELFKEDRASEDELDRAETEMNVEKFTVQRIEAQIDRRTLFADIDGIVTDIHKEVSEGVQNIETPVLTLVNIDKLLLNLFVDVDDARKISQGTEIPIAFKNSTQQAYGVITYISPDADKASRTVRVKILIDNTDNTHTSGVLASVNI